MNIRHLGDAGFTAAAIGFGCMGLSQGYRPTDDATGIATIHAAVDAGVTMFDTAMSYGEGRNEELLGRALRVHGVPRDRVQIATKFGIMRGVEGVHLDADPDRVTGWCEESLARLGSDYIDLYYLHRVDPNVPIEETVAAMADLITAGKVRHLGLSEVTVDQLTRACAVHPITAMQVEWSLMWREPERDVIPAARGLGVGIVPYSPLGRGLLGGRMGETDIAASSFRSTDPRFSGESLHANLAHVDALTRLAHEWGLTPAQVALAWLLAQGTDVIPIPGSRSPDKARENAEAMRQPLTGGQLDQLARAIPADGWTGDRRSFAVPVTIRSPGAETTR